MPVLCNFVQIIGDVGKEISELKENSLPTNVPLPDFNTAGRDAGQTASLVYSVRRVDRVTQVRINGNPVGTITKTPGTAFFTQSIAVPGASLNDGTNEIVLRDIDQDGIVLFIKDLACFFHKSI
jgi:hypothetical protein